MSEGASGCIGPPHHAHLVPCHDNVGKMRCKHTPYRIRRPSRSRVWDMRPGPTPSPQRQRGITDQRRNGVQGHYPHYPFTRNCISDTVNAPTLLLGSASSVVRLSTPIHYLPCPPTSISGMSFSFAGRISAIRKGTTRLPLSLSMVRIRLKIRGLPCRPNVPRTTPQTWAPRARSMAVLCHMSP